MGKKKKKILHEIQQFNLRKMNFLQNTTSENQTFHKIHCSDMQVFHIGTLGNTNLKLWGWEV